MLKVCNFSPHLRAGRSYLLYYYFFYFLCLFTLYYLFTSLYAVVKELGALQLQLLRENDYWFRHPPCENEVRFG